MASAVTASIAAGLSLVGSGTVVLGALVLAQTLGVVWLFFEGWSSARQWASATCVLAAVWAPLFLVASWIYVLDPGLLDVAPSPEPALALLNLALFTLIAAWLAFGGRSAVEQASTALVVVSPQRLRRKLVVVWMGVGLLGLGLFLILVGGPVEYLSNLDETGGRSAGLTYVVWVTLALKFSGLTVLAHYWASDEGQRRYVLLLVVTVVVLLSVFGQRSFIALMLVQMVLLYTLIRRPIRLGLIAPVAVLLLAALTFGIGTVKRYQNYTSGSPAQEIGFRDYVSDIAAREAVRAYIGNYADGVRLVAQARALVPREADYEKGRGFVRLAVQPIPSFIRPEVRVSKPLRPLLESSGGYVYALPLPLVGYVEFGFVGVVLGGCVLGFALVAVDRRLARDQRKLSSLLVLVALVVAIPFSLRSSAPGGVSFAALDVLGMWIVAGTCLKGLERRKPSRRPLTATG